MVDFHTHILHGIDDGSPSVQMSVAMIKELKEQGVSKIVVSPHFYAYLSSVDKFVEKRESAIGELVAELEKEDLEIDLYSGCEVLYFEDLWHVENLQEFCIKGTNFMLIEMPFSQWTDSIIGSIERIVGMGIIPIIAHFERYLAYKQNMEKIYRLVEIGALLQMNCSYFEGFFTRRKGLRFIKKGIVFALGTDCHDMDKRRPNYEKAVKYLKKKLPSKVFTNLVKGPNLILNYSEKIYSGA